MSFIGHYHVLVDDRIGSRVGDRCWAFADPYLRVRSYLCRSTRCTHKTMFQEKIARSLFTHEQFLAGSFYGKFFARNLNLYLLQRKPDDWKNLQSQHKLSSQPANSTPTESSNETPTQLAPPSQKPRKRKRDTRPDDEIDALFNASLGKRIKKGVLEPEQAPSTVKGITGKHLATSHTVTDTGLNDVLGAIRAAPKVEKGGHGKNKRAR
jgi:nucleolar protein 9